MLLATSLWYSVVGLYGHFCFATSHFVCLGCLFLVSLLRPLAGCTGLILSTAKKMRPEVIPVLESVFSAGLLWTLSFLVREAILALADARVVVMLSRVVQSTAVTVANLARAVAISCRNDLFFTRLFLQWLYWRRGTPLVVWSIPICTGLFLQ